MGEAEFLRCGEDPWRSVALPVMTAGERDSSLKTVLLVHDDDEARVTIRWFFTHFGYAVDCVRSAEEALAIFDPCLHDVVVTDHLMPGLSGAEMAHIIKLRSPATLTIMYTGLPPSDCSCLDAVVEKPTHLLVLKETVDRLLQTGFPG